MKGLGVLLLLAGSCVVLVGASTAEASSATSDQCINVPQNQSTSGPTLPTTTQGGSNLPAQQGGVNLPTTTQGNPNLPTQQSTPTLPTQGSSNSPTQNGTTLPTTTTQATPAQNGNNNCIVPNSVPNQSLAPTGPKGQHHRSLRTPQLQSNPTTSEPDLVPVLSRTWTQPSDQELADALKPRSFPAAPGGTQLTLTAEALGFSNMPVKSSNRLADLNEGLVRNPQTSLPGDPGPSKNVYIAGHYLGKAGSPARLAFYHLDDLKEGDKLSLQDGQGRTYDYRVSQKLTVSPQESWVMGQVRGRDMLTLQTCVPPEFTKRLIVRADRQS